MKNRAIMAALALTTATVAATPLFAQPVSSWDRETAWRGAPEGVDRRIDWLEQRIERGVADGSLSRSEARRAQRELDVLDRDANALERRLDDLSRSIRWARCDGYGGGYGYRDPYETDYDAARYYRDDPRRYPERRLTTNDEVYRGSDGRYYCKRTDGTTGLVIGGAGGALLGNVIDGGRSRVAGTLIGGALGALIGKSVEQNNQDYRCR